jgi:hypothetical protein
MLITLTMCDDLDYHYYCVMATMAWNVNESYGIFIFISPIFLTTFSTHIFILTVWLLLAT